MNKPAIDPVCGMAVEPAVARGGYADFGGKRYFFCNPKCREKFAQHPEEYLEPTHVAAQPADAQAWYVCPMDPEVRQRGPGACPKCGMALEPEMPTSAPADSAEERQLTRRLQVSLGLAIPLVILGMSHHAPSWTGWVQAILATPIVLWAGSIFFQRAWKSLRNRSPNVFTLIGLGTGTAFLYSAAALLWPQHFRSPCGSPTEGCPSTLSPLGSLRLWFFWANFWKGEPELVPQRPFAPC